MGMRMKEMAVNTVETGPHPDAMRREDLLQIAMLGALIASRELRSKVEPGFFTDKTFQCAVAELKGSNGSTFGFLSKVLFEYLGLEWKKSDGPPLPAMLDRLTANGQKERVVDVLCKAASCLGKGYRRREDLAEFFDAVEEAGRIASDKQADQVGVSTGESGGRVGGSVERGDLEQGEKSLGVQEPAARE